MNASLPEHPPATRCTAPRAAAQSHRRLLAGGALLAAALGTALSAAGRSEGAAPASRFVAAAPLRVQGAGASAAPARWLPDARHQEAGSSNADATHFDADDDHCFVANHAIVNAADGTRHFLQVTFRKRGHAVGLVRFGTDPLGLVEQARLAAPAAGVSVDVANHRIGFDHAVLTGAGGRFVLDGSYEYARPAPSATAHACG